MVSWALLALFAWLFAKGCDAGFLLRVAGGAAAVALLLSVAAAIPLRSSVRLSDWEPVGSVQSWGELRRDASVEGRRLQAEGFVFRRGLGTHAVSRIRYSLAGAFRRFETAFAIDDEARRGQRAQFRILVDGRVAFDSGLVDSGGFPRHTAVDVTGGRWLTLEVLDGGDGIASDHADWLEPTLHR